MFWHDRLPGERPAGLSARRPAGGALFKKQGDTPLTTGNDLNHLALNVAAGTYEALKADLEKHGVAVSGRPGEDRCIYFNDPNGHRLQLMVRP